MMDFIMAPAICGIFVLGFYKLFELFVCRKERLSIIEKMGDKFTPDMLEHKINLSSTGNLSFSALKFGSLFIGIGLGLLVAYLICRTTIDDYVVRNADWNWEVKQTISVIYGACVLLFGGVGLLASFLVELKISKK